MINYIISTRTFEVKEVKSITCDECGKDIPKVYTDSNDSANAEGSLNIHLSGGFGEYFDNMGPSLRLIFCKYCADNLCQSFKSISKSINEAE